MEAKNYFIHCLVIHKPEEGYRLSHLIHQACAEAKTMEVLPSWEEAIQYLNSGLKVDMIIGNYELIDLHPFAFDKMDKFIPVVFTSAKPFVTEKAFTLNCLDFINDHPTDARLAKSFEKYKRLYRSTSKLRPAQGGHSFQAEDSPQKARFLVKDGEQLFHKSQDEVAFFLADKGQTFLVEMVSGHHYLSNKKLMELEELLDSRQFFRINRSVILNIKAIGTIEKYTNNRLKITPKVNYGEELIVSREKVSSFKKWVNQ
ncbi:LytTR family DNA-binding domain-containing protein [Echinicola sediminis]